MLLNDADDIIAKAYKRLGEWTVQRMRNHQNGFGRSQKQKELYAQGKAVTLNLWCLLDHLILDDDGKIESTLRITDDQANRFLSTIKSLAETDLYATVPTLFFKVKPHQIRHGRDVQFQYSVVGVSWHNIYVPGDHYFRTSTDGGSTWTEAILFLVP